MKFVNRLLLAILFGQCVIATHPARAQSQTQKSTSNAAASDESAAQQKNMQAYIDLLRKDVRQEKAEIMGAVMVLSADDATKFWPIYSEYDAELTKLNDQRVEKDRKSVV